MKDQSKTKQVLILELASLRQRIAESGQSESERKQAEEALRFHSEILAHIVESVHLVRVDDGVIVYTNQRFDSVFGYDPGELVGKHVSIINAPGEKSPAAIANEIIRSLKQAGGIWNGEVHNIRKDGTSFWCSANVSTFKHPQYGEVWISVNRDITERKRMEETLRRAEENFRRSLEESPLGVRIVTAEGETIYANRAILDINGCDTLEELKTTPVEMRYTPESFAEHQIRREKRKRGDNAPSEYEIRIIRKDGEIRHLQVFRKEILWDGERQFQVLYNDITERKQAEEALRKSEEKLQMALTGAEMGMWDLDLTTMSGTVDERAAHILGYSKDDIPPQSHYWDEMTHLDDVPLIKKSIKAHIEGRIPMFKTEHRMRTTTGEWKWVQGIGKITKRHLDGSPIRISGTIHDISDRKRVEEALTESDERFRRLADAAWEGLFIQKEGMILDANEAAFKMFGYNAEEVIGHSALEFLAPESIEAALQKLKGNIDSSQLYLEAMGLRKNKTVFPMELLGRPIRYKNLDARVIAIRDITDRKQAEKALRESEERYRTLVENASDVVFRTDENGYFTFVNPVALRITRYEEGEILGKHYKMFIRPDMFKKAITSFANQLINKIQNTYTEYPILTKDGHEIWLGQNTQLIFQDGKVVAFQAVARDITEMKQAEEKIQQIAYHDSLTGLPNRKLFSDRLGIALVQAKRNQKEVGIAMFDLDHFKDVNDTLGHDVGDLFLKIAAERLSAALRKGDTVARFGGDEFVLILSDLKGIEDVTQVAQKIVDSFRKPFLIDAHQLTVTTSIGVAIYPHDGTDEGILLKNADIAMYQAKQTGRDRYQIFKGA